MAGKRVQKDNIGKEAAVVMMSSTDKDVSFILRTTVEVQEGNVDVFIRENFWTLFVNLIIIIEGSDSQGTYFNSFSWEREEEQRQYPYMFSFSRTRPLIPRVKLLQAIRAEHDKLKKLFQEQNPPKDMIEEKQQEIAEARKTFEEGCDQLLQRLAWRQLAWDEVRAIIERSTT